MVEFSNVSKTYNDEFEALKNVNLNINDGEFVFIVGASGAGKSTFLKLIMREEVPTSGTVTINGYNLNTMKKRDIPYFRRTMGIVFQDFRLIPDMRVYDNVAFALRVTGIKEREVRKRVTHALGMVGLLSKTHSLPKELSGGEQQRVAIARALVNNADLIIADEPTGNIDPAMSIEIMDLLNHINKANGTTIVMVTHAHELVKQYDHRIVVLKEGQIVGDGYDRSKILPLIGTETTKTDAGFYNAPNEYDDVEKFIFTYGQENVPIEETIPTAPPAETTTEQSSQAQDVAQQVVQEVIAEAGAAAQESAEQKTKDAQQPQVATATETPVTANPENPENSDKSTYSVADDEDISSILAAFSASTSARAKKPDSTQNSDSEGETDDSASDDNDGGAEK